MIYCLFIMAIGEQIDVMGVTLVGEQSYNGPFPQRPKASETDHAKYKWINGRRPGARAWRDLERIGQRVREGAAE